MPLFLERLRDYVLCAWGLGLTLPDRCLIFWRETKNLRVRLGFGSHRPTALYSLQTVYGRLYFRDNFGDITNLVNLFHKQTYRLRVVEQEGVILDVGANIGLAAAWFAWHNPGRTIYCFEPLAENAGLIARNCPGARVEQVALGARPGRVMLRVDRDNVMASRIPCRWETRGVEFEVVTLDQFAEAQSLGAIALLKIDAEGMEGEILEGGQRTLKNTQQVIMETHGQRLHDQAIAQLRRAGLEIDAAPFDRTTGMVFATRPKEASAPGGSPLRVQSVA
jgi:FkbM family methyltransferase